ncbi:MAG: helix-hairpin-helix domain-containing protein [Paludibacter sp.]
MWKDFFYFSRGQRVGIIVLLVLIFLVVAANFSLSYFFPVSNPDGSSFFAEVNAFKKTLVLRDSLKNAKWEREYAERQRKYEAMYHNFKTFPDYKKDFPYTLFPFDPNIADSATFVSLGIKPHIASNIMKYKSKGGTFKKTTDFGKVYGITPDKFKELEPFITIKEKILIIDSTLIKKKLYKQDVIVDINTADTSTLMQVRGLGRGYAKCIVRYRQQLGGFVSINQLNEVFGMRPENLEKIRPFCSVNIELIQKIRINIASAERLNAHPYISFYQAKAIYEFRRYKGKLHSINDLKELSELTADDLNKIKPYLNFE